MPLKDLDRTVRLLDEAGNFINIGNPLPTTGGGGGGGGTAIADEAVFTEGVSEFTPIGGVFNDVLGADLAEDTAGAARVTPKRALHVNLRSAAGVELGIAGNPLQIDGAASLAAVIDPANSTTTPLLATFSFTGGWTDVSSYAAVSVNIISDQSSATNGAEMQFSSNGTDIDNRELFFVQGSGAGAGKVVFSPIRAKYFRLRYLNGAVTQTFVRIQTLLHSHTVLPISDSANVDGKSATIATVPSSAYLHVYNGATWDRLRGNQISITLFASGARTTTQTSNAQSNFAAGGTMLFLNVTAAPASPGAGGLQVFFEAQDTLTSVWAQLNAVPVTVTAAGIYLYAIGSGSSAPVYPQSGGRVVQASGLSLPRTWRARIVHLDGQSYTYSVSHQYTV